MLSSRRLVNFLGGSPSTLHTTEPASWGLHSAILDDNTLVALEMTPARATPLPALKKPVIAHFREVLDETLLRFIISMISTLRRVDVTFDWETQAETSVVLGIWRTYFHRICYHSNSRLLTLDRVA
ncbi:hypothetical protein C8R45DRAFT_943589 [Mycena sanguinolenta]|nr:hypothetical protein C8R45DRAFT_943589 [Mycena sanguinolenta]